MAANWVSSMTSFRGQFDDLSVVLPVRDNRVIGGRKYTAGDVSNI